MRGMIFTCQGHVPAQMCPKYEDSACHAHADSHRSGISALEEGSSVLLNSRV